MRQNPPRPREMAGVPARVFLQVVLVLRLRLPERTSGDDLGDNFPGPQSGGVNVGDGVLGNRLLLIRCVKDGRSVTRTDVVALTVLGRRIMHLEKELEQIAVRGLGRIKGDLESLGVALVVAVRSVLDLPA